MFQLNYIFKKKKFFLIILIILVIVLLLLFKKNIWDYFYGTLVYKITGSVNDKNWTTMNYGYYTKKLNKTIDSNIEKYSLNFYDTFGNPYIKNNMDVLEISSGRGGGLKYLSNNWKNTNFLGIDYSKSNIQFSNNNHNNKNLKYITGNALNLKLNKKFDVILNIEASHAYNYNEQFYNSVKELLKKNSIFIYIDFIDRKKFNELNKMIEQKFNIIEYDDITSNVHKSLIKTNDYKKKLLKTYFPYNFILRKIGYELYGLKNSYIFKQFANKNFIYFAFVLSKK